MEVRMKINNYNKKRLITTKTNKIAINYYYYYDQHKIEQHSNLLLIRTASNEKLFLFKKRKDFVESKINHKHKVFKKILLFLIKLKYLKILV